MLNAFLSRCGLADATVRPLAQDASFRRYLRIESPERSFVVMDAPPPRERVEPFILVDEHLRGLGVLAPEILARDLEHGFLLLEDLGDRTFTRVLDQQASPDALYRAAVDTLVALHDHPEARRVDVPDYDLEALLTEASLLPDWYYPLLTGNPLDDDARTAYLDTWQNVLAALPPPERRLRGWCLLQCRLRR